MPTHVITDEDGAVSGGGAGGAQGGKFGNKGAGDYSEFEDDGTLVMHGDATAFRDEFGDITKLKVVGAGITETLTENTVGFQTNCSYTEDYLISNFQFNHDKLIGSSVFPHIHWFQTQNATPNFLVQYRWQVNGQAKTTAWSNLPMTTNAFTYVSGTLNQITHGAGIAAPANEGVSTILQVRVTRDKTNASTAFSGSDTHTVTAEITSFDVHLELDTLGSRTQYSK